MKRFFPLCCFCMALLAGLLLAPVDAFAQKYGRFLQEYAWTDSSFVAASRAVELDTTLSDAYKAMGVVYNYREEYDKAYPVLLKAIELNPSNEKAVGNLGTT